jgi:hypothetical protein
MVPVALAHSRGLSADVNVLSAWATDAGWASANQAASGFLAQPLAFNCS